MRCYCCPAVHRRAGGTCGVGWECRWRASGTYVPVEWPMPVVFWAWFVVSNAMRTQGCCRWQTRGRTPTDRNSFCARPRRPGWMGSAWQQANRHVHVHANARTHARTHARTRARTRASTRASTRTHTRTNAHRHVVFGKVWKGMPVVKAIEAVGSQGGETSKKVLPASSAEGLSPSLPHLRRDWGPPLQHLRRDWGPPLPHLRRDCTLSGCKRPKRPHGIALHGMAIRWSLRTLES